MCLCTYSPKGTLSRFIGRNFPFHEVKLFSCLVKYPKIHNTFLIELFSGVAVDVSAVAVVAVVDCPSTPKLNKL